MKFSASIFITLTSIAVLTILLFATDLPPAILAIPTTAGIGLSNILAFIRTSKVFSDLIVSYNYAIDVTKHSFHRLRNELPTAYSQILYPVIAAWDDFTEVLADKLQALGFSDLATYVSNIIPWDKEDGIH